MRWTAAVHPVVDAGTPPPASVAVLGHEANVDSGLSWNDVDVDVDAGVGI